MPDRTLRVNIIGDAKSLIAAIRKAELSLSSVGKVAGLAGGVMAAGLAVGLDKSAKAAIGFEEQMRLVQTQAGGTADDVKVLSKAILGLHTTQGPDELAKAMFHLKSIGLDNVDAMKTLKVASQGAMVGMAGLEETTNALGGAVKSNIRGAGDFSKAMGTLNAAVGAGNMRMGDLVGALSTGILPTARNAGLSLRDVAAAIADMTRQGMPAEQSATRLRTALMMMINPTDKAATSLEAVGLSGYKIGQAMRGPGGIVEAMQLLKDHFERIVDPVKRFQLEASALGGAKTAATVITLMNSVNDLGNIYDQTGKKAGEFGALVKSSQEDAANQLKIATENWRALQIEIGMAVIPTLLVVTSALAGVGAWLQQHSTLAKALVVALVGLTATLLAVSAAIKIVAAAEAIWTAAQWALNVAMDANPIGLIVVGLAALAAGIVLAWRHSETFRDIVISVWNAVKKVVVVAANVVRGEIDGIISDFQAVVGVLMSIINAAETAFSWLGKVFSAHPSSTPVGPSIGGSRGIPHYASGGIVPGPLGAPQLAVVHGGETVIPPGRGGGNVFQFSFPNYMGDREELMRMVKSAVKQANNRGDLLVADLR